MINKLLSLIFSTDWLYMYGIIKLFNSLFSVITNSDNLYYYVKKILLNLFFNNKFSKREKRLYNYCKTYGFNEKEIKKVQNKIKNDIKKEK